MIRQDLHIRIWQLSAILLVSSRLKLCQVGWRQTHIFRFLQKYLIAFNPRLWLDHSRTFPDIHPLVTSRIDYCDALFYGLPSKLLYKLQLVHNSAAQIICTTPITEHITPKYNTCIGQVLYCTDSQLNTVLHLKYFS